MTAKASTVAFLEAAEWSVLVHEKHGRTARDRMLHNAGSPRMLNVTGRWSSKPSQEVPVLVWHDRATAEACAAICRQHRGDGVVASSIGGTLFELGKHLVEFGPAHQPALVGYLPYGPTAAAKQEADRLKALASAAFLLARAGGNAALDARARELSPKAGSGAADFLTGKRGSAVAAAILSGQLADDQVVTRALLQGALELAQAIATVGAPRHDVTGQFRGS